VEDERDVEDNVVQDIGFASRSSWADLDMSNVQTAFDFERPSDEVANGDKKDDLELLDERDPEDDVVMDNGFAARSSWVQLHDNLKAKH